MEYERGRACSMRGIDEKYNILVGKPEGKRPFGISRCRWEDIRMDLREIGGKIWTGCTWLTIGTSDGFLCTRQ
jgi:hypothetical protein